MRSARASRLNAVVIVVLITSMAGIFIEGMALTARAAPIADDDPHPAILVIVESAFMVNTGRVIEYDRDLTFRIISFTNETKNCSLIIDGSLEFQTNFTNYKIVNYTHRSRFITRLDIYVNGSSVFNMKNIMIHHRRVSDYGIGDDAPAHFFDLSLSEWKNYQWQEFVGVIVGGLNGILMLGYISMYWYRKKFGEEVLASSF